LCWPSIKVSKSPQPENLFFSSLFSKQSIF
jgi:hypothetical protein